MKPLRTYSDVGYVRVEARGRPPRRWGWAICSEGSDIAIEHSTELYRCAEDALKAGQQALAQHPAPSARRRAA